jgi:hypothetical protein
VPLFKENVNILWFCGNLNVMLLWDISGMILIGKKEAFGIIQSQRQIVQPNSHTAEPVIGTGTSW